MTDAKKSFLIIPFRGKQSKGVDDVRGRSGEVIDGTEATTSQPLVRLEKKEDRETESSSRTETTEAKEFSTQSLQTHLLSSTTSKSLFH